MELVVIVIALALVQYIVFGMLVGRAHERYGIKAPAMAGHQMFDRYFRVHYNTMELLVAFVPAAWFFALYVSPPWSAGLGVVYLVGRLMYARGYLADPEKRSMGFMVSVLPVLALVIGALIGAARAAL